MGMVLMIDYQFHRMTQRIPHKVDDGEGGQIVTWSDGAGFDAALSRGRSAYTDEAEHDVFHASADLTTTRQAPRLFIGDVIRDHNGRTWRVVYVAGAIPLAAACQYRRYGVKLWEEGDE